MMAKTHKIPPKEIHEEARTLAAVTRPQTLGQILATLQAADDALIEMTPDQMRELGAMLAKKVDGYRTIMTKMAAEEARLREEADAFLKPARALAKAQERLEQVMTFHMFEHKMTSIPGKSWRVELKESEAVDTPQAAPTNDDQWNYPDFVRLKFEWDKVALKKALDAGDPKAKEVAKIKINYKPAFKVIKKEIE